MKNEETTMEEKVKLKINGGLVKIGNREKLAITGNEVVGIHTSTGIKHIFMFF